MRRRSVLLSAVPAALAGCSLMPRTPAEAATDVQLIAAGVAAVAQDVAKAPNVPQATLVRVQADALTVSQAAAKVAQASAISATLAQQIAAAVQEIAALVLPLFPATAPFVPLINAALSLLPTILAAAGVTGAPAAHPVYTPAEARLILRGAV